MRKRSARSSRSNLTLNMRPLYFRGLGAEIFIRPIEVPPLAENSLEIDFCEHILRDAPGHFEALVLLGDAYTRQGFHQKGLEIDLHLTRLRPESKVAQYNLACSYALTRQHEKALDCLERALALGYQDAEHLRQDPDLSTLRNDPRFQTLLEKIAGQPLSTRPE